MSTRAALRSLRPADPQRPDVLARGRSLLDNLETHAVEANGTEVSERLAAAHAELSALDTDAPHSS